MRQIGKPARKIATMLISYAETSYTTYVVSDVFKSIYNEFFINDIFLYENVHRAQGLNYFGVCASLHRPCYGKISGRFVQ